MNQKDNISKEKQPTSEIDKFWKKVFEQEKIYGNVSTPEVDWGPDVGNEIVD